jgi:hypothetical protein
VDNHGSALLQPARCELLSARTLSVHKSAAAVAHAALRAAPGEEAFFRPPWHKLPHPLVFYYAHPAVLYVNKLRVAGLISEPARLPLTPPTDAPSH